jgi:hypothetical protein
MRRAHHVRRVTEARQTSAYRDRVGCRGWAKPNFFQGAKTMAIRNATLWIASVAFVATGAALGAAETTLTGTVGDAMCGVKHMMENSAGCTEGCVKKGSDYALIVKDKAYTLKATDKIKGALAQLAGKPATVTGDQ